MLLVATLITAAGMVGCGAKGPAPVVLLPHEPVRMPIEMPVLDVRETQCPPQTESNDPNSTPLVWMAPADLPNLEAVVTTFEEQYPDIHVSVFPVAPEDYSVSSQQILAYGCLTPDLLNIPVDQSAYYAAHGWLASLWNQYTFDQKDDWIQALRKSGRYDQELYSAPFSTSTALLFFNRDIFTEGGVDLPTTDLRWTWEEVIQAAQKLTKDQNNDGSPEVWGLAWEDQTLHSLLPLAGSMEGSAIGEDGVTVAGVIDSPAWVEAFTFYRKVFNEWKVSPVEDTFQPVAAFMDGRVAILVGDADLIDQFDQVDFAWGVGRYPYFNKGMLVLPTGEWQLAVNAKTTHLQEAMTLQLWLTSTPGGTTLVDTGNINLPPEKTVLTVLANTPVEDEPLQSFWKLAASEALVYTLPGVITPYYMVYDQVVGEAFRQIRLGADVQSTLSQAALQMTEDMK